MSDNRKESPRVVTWEDFEKATTWMKPVISQMKPFAITNAAMNSQVVNPNGSPNLIRVLKNAHMKIWLDGLWRCMRPDAQWTEWCGPLGDPNSPWAPLPSMPKINLGVAYLIATPDAQPNSPHVQIYTGPIDFIVPFDMRIGAIMGKPPGAQAENHPTNPMNFFVG